MYIPLLQSLSPQAQAASSSSSSSSSNPGADLTSTFLTLLTAQLKSQSPINPLDPNAFVTQLATFNSLGELTQIQQLMQTLVNNTTPASHPAPSGSPSSGAFGHSTSTPSLTSVSR